MNNNDIGKRFIKYKSYNNITSGSSFNALVTSGVVHYLLSNRPVSLIKSPLSLIKSPFDTCPATLAPLSLINLQVAVGGQNKFNSTLNMTYEIFLQQINLAEQFF